MIGQHLPNNNKNATVPILQKKIASKPGPKRSALLGRGEDNNAGEKVPIYS
jgi:hypothetical protein